MLLSSIQVQGFKSFADKTTFKFGKGITGIVGPNGSGKSNISDAVRWVLGEQSTKSLRGQSMEDVIFGGTATRRPAGFCEVTLNIDNSDRTLNFDGDYVSVTRRFYRSHESEYLINNVSVRLKDINELFMDTGLGRDGYSMVGQGKIDAIISTKSQERRDIFEEASGISKYRYRRIESERKLQLAEENLVRLRDIMAELEGRVGPLKEQSEKATKFLELSENKKQLEIGLWLLSLENFKENLRNHESKITACKMRYSEIEKSLEEFDKNSENNALKFAEYTAKIDETHQNIAVYNEQIATLGGNISVAENDILHINETLTRLNSEIEEIMGGEEGAHAEMENLKSAAAEKTAKADELALSVRSSEEELANLLLSSENFSKQLEELNKSLNEISAKSADITVKIVTADSAKADLSARIQSLNALVAEKQTAKSDLDSQFNETQQMVNTVSAAIGECENALKGYNMRLESRKAKADELKQQSDSLHLDIESKIRRVQMLEDLEKNMEGFNHSVKTVMSSSKSGVLRGVIGTVSQIINVKKEHSVAIETALGNTLQNIVVESEADAKRAINSLKESGSGRATFLPVASIKARPFSESGYEDMYGYVGLASDIVECEPKYKELIKYLLGAVVITEDLDSAVNIAKKFNYHFKTVSLDGQVVNAGGSLTGGSLVKNAGILSRKGDIERINGQIESAKQKEKLLLAEYESAKNDLAAVEADITAAQAELTTANEDNIRAQAELKRIDDLRQTVLDSLNAYNAEIAESTAKIEDLSLSQQAAKTDMAALDAEKEALLEKTKQAAGGRDSLSGRREELTSAITAIKLSEIECRKDAENLLASVMAIESGLANKEERVAATRAQIEENKALIAAKNADIEAINAAVEALKQQIADAENSACELSNSRNALEQNSTEIRALEKETTLEREKIGGELARLTERKETMAAEYDNIIKQLFDEYGLTRSEAEATGITVEKPAEAKKELSEIRNKIRALGNVNVAAIEEYKEVGARYEFMAEQIEDVEKSRLELKRLINQLTAQMQEMFVTGFNRINENFEKTFTDLFGGGSAKLVLTDPENILESGIDIVAKLPGKNVPSLDGLSGGEKAMTALAIYFAIMRVSAPPFCFLDEVDTALDDINVDRFADYMRRAEFGTQFICVTHRRGTMEVADMLYGVTMQEKGVTKLLELNVSELAKKLPEVEM